MLEEYITIAKTIAYIIVLNGNDLIVVSLIVDLNVLGTDTKPVKVQTDSIVVELHQS